MSDKNKTQTPGQGPASERKAPTGNPPAHHPMHHVAVFSLKGTDRVFRLHKERIVIGSVVSADVRIVGTGVAPIHAVIEITANPAPGLGVATIYDLASETG